VAGCQPCTAHHVEAARKAGATETEIRCAVEDALSVRRNSTKVMANVAKNLLGAVAGAKAACCDGDALIHELVSATAALALNCATSLENHLEAAQRLGASNREIQSALGVARLVKKVASQKAEAAMASVSGSIGPLDRDAGSEPNSCDCRAATRASGDAAPECCV
jgi:alkylhydroperoxidase/carboxymuconolactone decarboxylase family protein YurZ